MNRSITNSAVSAPPIGIGRYASPTEMIGNSGMAWYQVVCTSLMPHTSMKRLVTSMQISRNQPR